MLKGVRDDITSNRLIVPVRLLEVMMERMGLRGMSNSAVLPRKVKDAWGCVRGSSLVGPILVFGGNIERRSLDLRIGAQLQVLKSA